MFSPSLLSMIWHSLAAALPDEANDRHLETSACIARELGDLWRIHASRSLSRPEVPVVARMQTAWRLVETFPAAAVVERRDGKGVFVHGRFPVDKLIAYFQNNHSVPAAQELLDLGTPLASQHAAGGGSLAACTQLMQKTGGGPHAIDVAFIDRGDNAAGPPQDFNGRLQHAVVKSVDLSAHAMDVLAVLLDRLNHHGRLGSVAMHCALVPPPATPIGLACFDHANSVELLASLTQLDRHLAALAPGRPVAANLSMGCHVGPHDGNSPLEDFVRHHFDVQRGRYLHVAAGNDGQSGVAAIRLLPAGMDEHLRLRVGPTGCTELLVEFWWDARAGSALQVEVELSRLGMPISIAPLTIDSTQANASLAQTRQLNAPLTCQSLFHAACYGNRSCVAFAASAPSASDLANVDVDFVLRNSSDTMINAWIVVCPDERSAFMSSATSACLCVPATDPEVVSVSGVIAGGQPWSHSSRGPAAVYSWPLMPAAVTPPYLAHLVEPLSSPGPRGTSFASPRACADTVALLLGHGHAAHFTSASDLARQLVGAHAPVLPVHDHRIGFGAIWQ